MPPAVRTASSDAISELPSPDLPRDDLIRRLAALGWLGEGDTPEERVDDAIQNVSDRELRRALLGYQNFHGLEADTGQPDAETKRSLAEPRFCGLPDVMPIQSVLSKWGNPVIPWTMGVADWPKIGIEVAREAFALAFQQWAEVCGILPQYTADPQKALLTCGCNRIDGQAGVLAWSELPGNATWKSPLKQLYDNAEAWCNAEDPPRYQIDLVRVACHEIGHALGLPHIAAGNLLQPTYDVRIRKPQAGDIAEVVARYGPPKTDRPPPVSGGKATILIELEGGVVTSAAIPGFRVTRVVG